jgi:hypothetical protein
MKRHRKKSASSATSVGVTTGSVKRHPMESRWFMVLGLFVGLTALVQSSATAVAQAPPLAVGYTVDPPIQWAAGETKTFSVTLENIGSEIWRSEGDDRGDGRTHLPIYFDGDSGSVVGGNAELPGDVAPGDSVTIQVEVTAPSATGSYFLRHHLVKEGMAFFEQTHVTEATIIPELPAFAASYDVDAPTQWVAGHNQPYEVTVTNIGREIWNATGPNNVLLGVHFFAEPGRWVTDQRLEIPRDVAPGESLTLPVEVRPPEATGRYILRHRMAKNGVLWFEDVHDTQVAVGANLTMDEDGVITLELPDGTTHDFGWVTVDAPPMEEADVLEHDAMTVIDAETGAISKVVSIGRKASGVFSGVSNGYRLGWLINQAAEDFAGTDFVGASGFPAMPPGHPFNSVRACTDGSLLLPEFGICPRTDWQGDPPDHDFDNFVPPRSPDFEIFYRDPISGDFHINASITVVADDGSTSTRYSCLPELGCHVPDRLRPPTT